MRSIERAIAIDRQYEVALDIEIARGHPSRIVHSLEEFGKGNTGEQMRLWIEHDLDIAHILVATLVQVGQRDVVKVAGRTQHRHALVVMLDEFPKIARRIRRLERLRGAQRLDAAVRQRHLVSLGELPFQLGCQGAFDMQMQLGFRQAGKKCTVSVGDVGKVRR